MHNGSQAFNADPENARLADDYAIVMGSSHCEQMLRNNEDEWKNAGTWGGTSTISPTEIPTVHRFIDLCTVGIVFDVINEFSIAKV